MHGNDSLLIHLLSFQTSNNIITKQRSKRSGQQRKHDKYTKQIEVVQRCCREDLVHAGEINDRKNHTQRKHEKRFQHHIPSTKFLNKRAFP